MRLAGIGAPTPADGGGGSPPALAVRCAKAGLPFWARCDDGDGFVSRARHIRPARWMKRSCRPRGTIVTNARSTTTELRGGAPATARALPPHRHRGRLRLLERDARAPRRSTAVAFPGAPRERHGAGATLRRRPAALVELDARHLSLRSEARALCLRLVAPRPTPGNRRGFTTCRPRAQHGLSRCGSSAWRMLVWRRALVEQRTCGRRPVGPRRRAGHGTPDARQRRFASGRRACGRLPVGA